MKIDHGKTENSVRFRADKKIFIIHRPKFISAALHILGQSRRGSLGCHPSQSAPAGHIVMILILFTSLVLGGCFFENFYSLIVLYYIYT